MRPIFAALLASAALSGRAAAANDFRPFEDAPLHAVQFVDAREGWAVGDDGVIWHTINGGKVWERQPTGVRASLRSVHFLNPYTGWAAGREELASGGSAGVLLYTNTGGEKWQRVTLNALPGLNRVRFIDNGTGFLAGDATDLYPSGVFKTTDSGRTWVPLPGKRGTTWLAADFQDADNGALGGSWNRLASMRRGTVTPLDVDTLGGRTLYQVCSSAGKAVAVGQGGVLLANDDTAGSKWALADLRQALTPEAQGVWDFHAVALHGRRIWVAGRPGSVLLHSGDGGATWEVRPTRQPLPLHGLFFADETHGWAVGDLGAILATTDGGKTWEVQRRGGERAALLCIHARLGGVPLETVAGLGGDEGYLTTAVRVVTSDPTTAALGRATEALRFAGAVRQAGGATAETLWAFPVPEHLARSAKGTVVDAWNRRHGGRAAEELVRQLVLTLRTWRPDVVITDPIQGEEGLDGLVGEAVQAACNQAADPKAFPEQIEMLCLKPWQVSKVYSRRGELKSETTSYVATEPSPRLQASPRDFATPAAALFYEGAEALAARRGFVLLESRLEGSEKHRHVMDGLALAPRGEARRDLGETVALSPEVEKGLRAQRTLQALAEQPQGALLDGDRLLSQIAPQLAQMPDSQAASAAFGLANGYARLGRWDLARELYGLVLERYPTHPLAADACQWLIRHAASGEARRRQELSQKVSVTTHQVQTSRIEQGEMPVVGPRPRRMEKTGGIRWDTKTEPNRTEFVAEQEVGVMRDREAIRRWHAAGPALEPRLNAFGPLYASDPATILAIQSAHRSLGDGETPRKVLGGLAARQPAGPWRDAAQAELWLLQRNGEAPKPVLTCRQIDTRPFLDGKLDDPCWKAVRPIPLRAALNKETTPGTRSPEDSSGDYPTEVFLAYDKDYLYLGLRCRHPSGQRVEPVKVRPRDSEVRRHDHVNILLDMDRDYSSFYHLQIDQRGCVADEHCQDGVRDRTWNPRWFVACHSESDFWQIEAAIPLSELSGDPVTLGKAWACNVVRVIPGRGVQGASLPADAVSRPEGMGLLLFSPEAKRGEPTVPLTMPRAQ